MNMKLGKIIFILISLHLSSCVAPTNTGFNQPITLDLTVPDGPREFKAGWYNGCRTGLSNKYFANSFPYQGEFRSDFGSGVYQHDSVYQGAWGQGFFACTIHSSIFTSEGYPMRHGPLE